jgi:hypothetical protein
MASSKDTFESHSFRAHSFASGLWRGLGAANALVGPWSNVIPCQSVNQRIECQSVNSRIECQSSNRRIETP